MHATLRCLRGNQVSQKTKTGWLACAFSPAGLCLGLRTARFSLPSVFCLAVLDTVKTALSDRREAQNVRPATMKRLLKKVNGRLSREGSQSSTSEPDNNKAASLSSSSTLVATAANVRPERFGLFRLDAPSTSTSTSTSPSLDDNNSNQPGQFPVDIIAVHGLSGDAYSTWTHPNGTLWLRDLLPDFLPGCRVYTYGYPSQAAFTRSYADVSAYARRLLDSIRGLSEGWNEVTDVYSHMVGSLKSC